MTNPSRTGVTTGVASGPRHSARPPGRRGRKTAITSLALGSIGLSLFVAPEIASAAVPSFPDNVVVFPDRDFVTVEGYQDHIGQTATVEVWRGTQIVGSAQSVVAAGDVAFEINHPGGACWGAGTNLKVTPDIKPGDRVSIRFGTAANADADDSTTVADAFVDTDSVLDEATRTLVITGHFNAALNPTQVEQRVVNPDLTGTDVQRRDIRAVPGGMTPAPKGGYQSNLEVDPAAGTFKATYIFNTLETAKMAATGGGERFMSWQVEDGDANRQGLTIAEYGELGGPGMGGCPAGPADVGAPAGTAQVIRSAEGTSAQVSWTPTDPLPGAAAVTGYSVLAVAPAGTDPAAPVSQAGVRTGSGTKQATLSGLTAGVNYTFEVRSIADGSMSKPFTIGTATGGTQPPTADANLTLSPAGGTQAAPTATGLVTATGNSAGQIWYTTDGTPAVNGDALADSAKLYTAPVPVTAAVNLRFAFFNADGNVAQASGYYTPGASQLPPAAPATLTSSNLQQDRVTLTWPAVNGAVGYQVVATGTVAPIPATTALTQTITGLAPSTSYTFVVKAKNAEGTLGNASPAVSVTTPRATDRITIATGRYRAGDRFEMSGSGTLTGAAITIRTSADPASRTLATATVAAPVAPATTGTWDIRLRGAAVPTNVPAQVWAHSSGGGVAGPFTLAR